MSNKIHLLPPDLINKIAAGEVVERPASIVKELIENAIDANATKITLKVENGGINYIEVSDDGTGMVEEDAKLAFVQHATSKIKSSDDLNKIFTLGFRGEALASISSVSKLKIHTKTHNGKPVLAKNSSGKIITQMGDARNQGTTVIVENVFEQIPARRKFLKSELTEFKNILQTFIKTSLSHPGISFDFYNNSKLIHSLNAVETFQERITQLFPNLEGKLIPISFDDKYLQVSGFIGHPEINRRDSTIQYIFVNKRGVNDPVISKALKIGYGTNLMHNQFPVYFVNLKIDEEKIDVNVHPRKSEIRFENSQEIFRIIQKSVRKALEGHLQRENNTRFSSNNSFEDIISQPRLGTSVPKSDNFNFSRNKASSKNTNTQTSINFTKELLEISENSFDENSNEPIPQILQVFNTYLIIQKGDELLIIDQHAADERINCEKIEKRFKNEHSISSQKLLIPETLHMTKSEQIRILENIEVLLKLGFEFRINKNKTELISIPKGIYSQKLDKLLDEIIGSIDESSEIVDKEENSVLKKLIATIACHSSIRAGQKLDSFQARELFKELLKCSQPYSCPHGRPIIWIINQNEIEKNFKRK